MCVMRGCHYTLVLPRRHLSSQCTGSTKHALTGNMEYGCCLLIGRLFASYKESIS